MSFDGSKFQARLADIDWFASVRAPIDDPTSFDAVSTIDDVVKKVKDPYWDSMRQDWKNHLSSYLDKFHTIRYQHWNDGITLANQIIDAVGVRDSEFIASLPAKQRAVVWMSVQKDLRCAFIEFFFADIAEPAGFTRLLSVYEVGRMVCGWSGNWPAGKPLAY
ncbi:MAG: hypothetical protein AAGK09_14230 [Planctomycetota bacterium]